MMRNNERMDAAVDQTLQYYACFRFPLSAQEVWQYSNTGATPAEVASYLDELVLTGRLHAASGYYARHNDVIQLLDRRLRGGAKAGREIRLAKAIGSFIYGFPFVRFVGISGSLSKGFSDSSSDFDFFIVTAGSRLWIARSLLHVLKKLSFLIRQQHKLCMNYFLDDAHLGLEDRNVYVATELCTMIPVRGAATYEALLAANPWRADALPNFPRLPPCPQDRGTGLLKRCTEWILNHCAPESLNRALMRYSDARWRRQWNRLGYPPADYEHAFMSRLHVSKNHRINYQKRVLAALSREAVT